MLSFPYFPFPFIAGPCKNLGHRHRVTLDFVIRSYYRPTKNDIGKQMQTQIRLYRKQLNIFYATDFALSSAFGLFFWSQFGYL